MHPNEMLPFSAPEKGGNGMYFDQAAFGRRLKKIRETMGISQEKMAEKLNISKVHYGNMERGKACCSLDLLVEMSCTFKVSTDYLLKGAENSNNEDVIKLQNIILQLTDIKGRM